MNSFFDYLLQLSAVLIILYLPYQFLFRKETLFTLNRFYLLAILIISWIVPLINIPFGDSAPEFGVFRVQFQAPVVETAAPAPFLSDIRLAGFI